MGKITKGTIEIVTDVKLIKEGDKVGMSDSTLLNMLGISPFTYGLVVQKVYDSGTVFDPAILDITDDDLKARAGAIAPLDVTVPAQNTGLGPEKTSFFQALNIPTKITKGTIEIIADVKLIKEGDKVG